LKNILWQSCISKQYSNRWGFDLDSQLPNF